MSARVFGPAYGAEYCASVISSLAAAARSALLAPRPGRAAVVELNVALAQHAPIAVKSTVTAAAAAVALFLPGMNTERAVVVASELDVSRASSTSSWVLELLVNKDRTKIAGRRSPLPIDLRSPRSGTLAEDDGDVIDVSVSLESVCPPSVAL
jgi:uncharacterized protein YijF (DUF1287 family)